MSIRDIARTFHHSRRQGPPDPRRTPAQALHPHQAARRPRSWAPSRPLIDAILAADETAPPKQRHTAMQVFRRLRDEHGYAGGYDQVRRYVGTTPPRPPRDLHPPGPRPRPSAWRPTSATSTSISPTAAGWCPVLIVAWAYSNYPFALALPTERTEAILARPGRGVRLLRLRAARGVVGQPHDGGPSRSFTGRERRLNPRYAGPGQPLHLRAAVLHAGHAATRSPTPRTGSRSCSGSGPRPCRAVADLAALNAHLRAALPGRGRSAPSAGYDGDDRPALRARPGRGRCRCRRSRSTPASCQPARWTSTRRCASTATATACRGAAPSGRDGQGLRRPRRGGGRRPGGGRGTRAVTAATSRSSTRCTTWRRWSAGRRRWTTPRCYATGNCPSRSPGCGRRWKSGTGRTAGARQYIRVLQLLAEHPLARVQQAVERCLRQRRTARRTDRRAGAAAQSERPRRCHASDDAGVSSASDAAGQYQVPRPDLGRFDQLLTQGEHAR